MISKIIDLLQSQKWGNEMPTIELAKGKNELPKNYKKMILKLAKK